MTFNKTLRKGLTAAALAISAATIISAPPAQAQDTKVKAEIVLVDVHDKQAVRNVNNILTVYQGMINENNAVAITAKFVTLDYIQHNPLIGDGSVALGKYFAAVKSAHPSAHVVVYKVIAVGEYVFVHLNFFNLLTDDPADTGVAGVDIYRMNAEGQCVEHWDTLQLVGDPKNSASWVAANLPRVNANKMF